MWPFRGHLCLLRSRCPGTSVLEKDEGRGKAFQVGKSTDKEEVVSGGASACA